VIDMQSTPMSPSSISEGITAERAAHGSTMDTFHQLFYDSKYTHGMSFYEGVPVLKNPLDLWVAQEIIWDLQPTLIIETGTAYGGSALYYARQLDRVNGGGKVLSIDLEPADTLPHHPRITYLKGYSSTHSGVVGAVRAIAADHPRVMVVLDSDHSKRHVLRELEAYAPMVSQGQFLVVEDTNINGRPVRVDWQGGPGPGPAVDEWLPEHPEFEQPAMAQRFMVTFHTWLRRKT
jgi:cephalosporin hydroxylase